MLRTAALATLLVGCASNDQIAPTSLEYDDLALSVASTVAMPRGGGELGAFSDVVALAHGQLPAGFTVAEDGSVRGTHIGLGYSYHVVCRSAQGAPSASESRTGACGSTTDSVDAQVAWTGALELPNTGMEFDRTGLWALSGLTQGIATASGTATLAYDSRIANPDRGTVSTYHLAYDATYDGVAYDTVQLVALGGDIHYMIAVDRHETDGHSDSTRHYDVDATITLNGDGTATVDLDGAHQYKLTLATSTVVRI